MRLGKTLTKFLSSLPLREKVSFLCTLNSVKPVMRDFILEKNLNLLIDLCRELKLYIYTSDFGVESIKDFGTYANVEKRTLRGKPGNGVYFYISTNKKKAKKAKELDEGCNHKELGLLLGYPECCAEFFSKNTSGGEFLKNVQNKKTYNYYINYAARYFGYSLIYHFPCDFGCQESVKLAKTYLECFKRYSPEEAKMLEEYLRKPVIYSENQVILFKKFKCHDNILSIGSRCDILATNKIVPFSEVILKNKVARFYDQKKYKFSIYDYLSFNIGKNK